MEKQILLGVQDKSPLIRRDLSESLPNNIRTEFMRDRDRVLYSEPFRRLAGKTQVYSFGNSDHLRTRLTHTLEVSQIARTISAYLQLNSDLTESIALAHDIGHAPFGHAGERALHSIMTVHDQHCISNCPFDSSEVGRRVQCGYKHNLQGVKLSVSSGLNLTNFTLYGIETHSKLKYNSTDEDFFELDFYKSYQHLLFSNNSMPAWSLEAYVVSVADEIAQRHHDLEDAITGNLITKAEVNKIISENLCQNHCLDATLDNTQYEKALSSFIVNMLVSNLIRESESNVLAFQKKYNITNPLQRDNLPFTEELRNLISYPLDFKEREVAFAKEIRSRVISSYDIQSSDARGTYIIKKIFQAYYESPQQLPDNSIISFLLRKSSSPYKNITEINEVKHARGIGYLRKAFTDMYSHGLDFDDDVLLMRVICDHIAGMTDNYAISTYRKLYGNL